MNSKNWTEHLQQWHLFLDERLSSLSERKKCENDADEITKIHGEITKIKRQRTILEEVRYSAVLNPRLLLEFINPTAPKLFEKNIEAYSLKLNNSQKHAVSVALNDNVLSLIQGPPGTGKTQVIAEICLQLYQKNPNIRILICSETHIAVNNLIARISEKNDTIRIVRIRNKELDEISDQYSPESIIRNYKIHLSKVLRNKELAELITETISDYDAPSLEKALALSANIAGMTCNRVGAYTFDTTTEAFDVVIIDEVCKATLPEILMPLSVAQKAILVGDPKQLPPVFCSEELDVIRSIEDCHLQKYMYVDALFSLSNCTTFLDTQYRMAEKIGSLIGTLFYPNKLINGRSSQNLGKITWIDYKLTQNWPIDTNNEKPSIYNSDECSIIESLIYQLDAKSNNGQTIAIITPYRGQVFKLKESLRKLCPKFVSPRVDTVDGFQGKESDIVVFSLTRTHGPNRFLTDSRRLNVALSRAKSNIYIVGYLKYAKKNKLLRKVSTHCEILNFTQNH